MSIFNQDPNEVEKNYNLGSGEQTEWFQIEEGDNRVRLLTGMAVFPQHFSQSDANVRGVCIGKDNNCPGCELDEKLAQEDKGKSLSVKWLCWVLDWGAVKKNDDATMEIETENAIKLAKLPHTVAKQIGDYQNDEDYAFDETPMPYDISIMAENAGTTKVKYNLVPRPHKDLPEEVKAKAQELTDPSEIIDKMKEKKVKELGYQNEPEAQYHNEQQSEQPK